MPAAEEGGNGAASRRCVLVVDDDFDIREVMRELLCAEGYAVLTAADGSEALTALRAGTRPDVLLLDLTMPEVSGIEVIDVLRKDESLRAIPVVVCSVNRGYDPDDLGVHSVLRKPVAIDDLLEAVKKALPGGSETQSSGIETGLPRSVE
jgi:CheY-like chemotaxis protein